MGEACMDIFRPTPSFARRTFANSRFSTEGILISAFAVPHLVLVLSLTYSVVCLYVEVFVVVVVVVIVSLLL